MLNIQQLKIGDIIRNIGSGTAYTISSVTDDKVIAVREMQVTNPIEWELVDINNESAEQAFAGDCDGAGQVSGVTEKSVAAPPRA